MELSARLKNLRNQLKISQKEFAETLGFKQSYYSDVENGKRPVSTKIIEGLRKKYNVSSEWVYTGNGDIFLTDSNSKSISENVSHMYPSDKIPSRKFQPYDFYKGLSEKDLDFELSIEYEQLKGIYGDYILLSELVNKNNAPDFLKEKFEVPQPFKDYIESATADFEEEHQHIKDVSRLKILKIVDLYLSETDRWRFLTSKIIRYLYQYSDMIMEENDSENERKGFVKPLKDRF